MALAHSRMIYVIAMLLAGIVIGFIVAPRPHLHEAAIMPAFWPLAVSFVLELLIGPAVARGQAQPLTMSDRFFGVFGAGLIVVAFMYAMG